MPQEWVWSAEYAAAAAAEGSVNAFHHLPLPSASYLMSDWGWGPQSAQRELQPTAAALLHVARGGDAAAGDNGCEVGGVQEEQAEGEEEEEEEEGTGLEGSAP